NFAPLSRSLNGPLSNVGHERQLRFQANHASVGSSGPSALNERWTMRRKATLVFAVRSGRISIEEACRVYKLSVDEFRAWERNLDRYGIPGLRTTRYQIYRGDERRAERMLSGLGSQLGPSPMPNGRA